MEFFTSLNVWYKRGIAGAFGAVAGFAYYYYIGCNTGTCPITSNPYISTVYGTVVGVLLINNNKKREKETPDGNGNTSTG
jgi:hypothetical protein